MKAQCAPLENSILLVFCLQLWEVIKFPTQVVRIFRGSLHPFPRDVNFSPPVTVTTNLALAKIASPTEANRCALNIQSLKGSSSFAPWGTKEDEPSSSGSATRIKHTRACPDRMEGRECSTDCPSTSCHRGGGTSQSLIPSGLSLDGRLSKRKRAV